MKKLLLTLISMIFSALPLSAENSFEKDVIQTSAGNLEITFIGHGSLMLIFNEKIIHVDPYSKLADYTKLPPADLILLTHHHPDHLDLAAIQAVRTKKTQVLLTELCAKQVTQGLVMKNGDERTVMGIQVKAIPAYNLVHQRSVGEPYHPKGEGNGYVLSIGGKQLYIAGDTENTPEMKALRNIDYAFVPMNLPYTMTPQMVADAARAFKPKVLYPYHYGDTDTSVLVALLKNDREIEIRIRKMP
ncbi:MBL fold metallo-hydrolase [Deltaproteobacteria bacterium TL4]